MVSPVSRRTFLQLLALASTSAVAGARPQATGRRVVVLGAGLAGLAAAWNLMRHGYEVVVLEAQEIPGGRVKTILEPFKNGGYAEAGALRIPGNHRWTMKYIEAMGLASKLRAYDDAESLHLWYLDGKRFTTPTGAWPLHGLSAREKGDPFASVSTYWGPAFKAVGDPTRTDFPDAAALALDRYRIDELWAKEGASDAWIKVLLAEEGDGRRLNALAATALFAALDKGASAETKTYGLVGGNDQLPKALAARLGTRVRYRSPVLRLAHGKDGIVVTFRDSAGQHQISADHCICTLPFPLLRQIAITPAFSADKMDAIHEYGLLTASRVYYQTRTRFWRKDPLGPLGGLNMIGTDTPAERIWNTSLLQPDNTMGMLQSYMIDQRALAFGAIPPQDRVEESLKAVSTFLPGLRPEVEATYTKVWLEDPWQKGVMGHIPAGAFKWMWPAARRAEGGVHFAGEHTSAWVGFQNGALESAERVVQDILQQHAC